MPIYLGFQKISLKNPRENRANIYKKERFRRKKIKNRLESFFIIIPSAQNVGGLKEDKMRIKKAQDYFL